MAMCAMCADYPHLVAAGTRSDSTAQRVLEWVRRRRNLVAALIALWVVWRVVRWVLGMAWATRGLDGLQDAVADFAVGHWVAIAAGALLLGALVFVAVRAGLARLPWSRR